MYQFVKRVDIEIKFVLLRKNVERKYKNNFRNANSLVYYINGGHNFYFEDKNIVGRAGDVVLLPYGACYENELISDDTEYYQIDFCVYQNGKPQAIVNQPTVIKTAVGDNLKNLFGNVFKNYTDNRHSGMLLCIADTLKILSFIEDRPKNFKKKDKTQEIVYYIKETCFDDITVEEIAEHFGISVSQLEKRIKAEFGVSPVGLKNSFKIEKAKQLLAEGVSIKEVAYSTGFSDRYYFTKIFTRTVGQTPTQFIKNLAI